MSKTQSGQHNNLTHKEQTKEKKEEEKKEATSVVNQKKGRSCKKNQPYSIKVE
jgi:hypothetical protein